MPSFQQGLQGRNVYGGGSFAPTRGQVSAQGAQGYLKRTLRQRNQGNQGIHGGVSRFGGDGQSDTRSGMAAQAANRAGGNRWAGFGEGMPGFNPGGKKPFRNKGRPATGGGQGGGGQGTPQRPGGGGQPPVNVPQSVTVNDQGQIELPYSQAWSESLLANLSDYNMDLQDLQQMQQEEALQYGQTKRDAAEGYEVQKRGTLNDNAARGVAFSSGHGVAVGNDARDYNNYLAEVEQGHASANAGFDSQRNTIIANMNQQMQQDALDYAAEMAEQAGSLGYGRDKQKVKKHKLPKKPPVRPNNGNHQKAAQNKLRRNR